MTTDGLLLLDTCAAIWLMEGRLAGSAVDRLEEAYDEGSPVFASPITAWEVGLLVSRNRLALTMPPEQWFAKLVALPGIALAEMPPAVLIAASFLPGRPPRDPADRIILATARELGLRVMTRDRLLLTYAEQGHVSAVAC